MVDNNSAENGNTTRQQGVRDFSPLPRRPDANYFKTSGLVVAVATATVALVGLVNQWKRPANLKVVLGSQGAYIRETAGHLDLGLFLLLTNDGERGAIEVEGVRVRLTPAGDDPRWHLVFQGRFNPISITNGIPFHETVLFESPNDLDVSALGSGPYRLDLFIQLAHSEEVVPADPKCTILNWIKNDKEEQSASRAKDGTGLDHAVSSGGTTTMKLTSCPGLLAGSTEDRQSSK